MDSGYTWMSQNTSYGLYVVFRLYIYITIKVAIWFPRMTEGFGQTFCMKNL